MRLHITGFKLSKLGSIQDRVIRDFMTKESEKESKKVQINAILAIQSLPEDDDRVKKLWREYLGLEYGIEIPENSDKEIEMMDYYQKVVKNLKPELSMKDGKLMVSGLGSINPNPNQQG
jgi:hypothetical protein